jgi:hypothetical protein
MNSLKTYDPAAEAADRYAATGNISDLNLALTGVVPGERISVIDITPRTPRSRKWFAVGAVSLLAAVPAGLLINSRLDHDRMFQTGRPDVTQPDTTSPKAGPAPNCDPVIAQAGDTVWEIVRDTEPSGDIREIVYDIVDEQLGGKELQAGDEIIPC